ncbi:hypothetical protein TrVE_jg7340 [Triparma verrucosa]|uniref:Uncharacterized protein n=2 Tax=Triparma TaxID=722752 RepID=A0A9W7ER48_9STRA|nr:hypothetical protein TrST_g13932 [Triparma strigata]GMH88303.1 hypothetical protein TrVE_jg7340 [Triparma verrucosa]
MPRYAPLILLTFAVMFARSFTIPFLQHPPSPSSTSLSSKSSSPIRRTLLTTSSLSILFPLTSSAKEVDCLTDCVKNCKVLAPLDKSSYCLDSCTEYCADPEREDGLSGSKSSEKGEYGILGGGFGQGTVTKGNDKPPQVKLPFLDFETEKGKKLIGEAK